MMQYISLVASLFWIAQSSAFTPALAVSVHNGRSTTTKLSMSIPNAIDTLTSGLVSIYRLPDGITVLDESSSSSVAAEPPVRLLELYDIENSLGCRKVRELITELDLVVETVIPATKNSRAFIDPDYKYALPDDAVIPRLVLIENGQEKILSGADAICNALETAFALPKVAEVDTKEQVLSFLREIGGYVSVLLRIGRGMRVSPAAAAASNAPRPVQPLVLYSYESNQFCRLVREVLTELDLPYQLRSAGKGSPRRDELAETSGGSTQCPYLLDPNRDTAMAESSDIIRYLYRNYALWTPPNEILQWASEFVLPLVKPVFSTLAPLQAGSYNKDDEEGYLQRIATAKAGIEATIRSAPVVVYTYGLSPFSFETKALLENLDIDYKEVSLGAEWIPGLINKEGGSETRVALLEMTGQSSLPHVFIGGQSIGGLYSGNPGLLPMLEQGKLMDMVYDATNGAEVRLGAA